MKKRKLFSKVILFILVFTMGVTTFNLFACGGTSTDDGSSSSGKTELKIVNYDGGVGHAWLDSLITKFEAKYKDISLQDGKTGVKVTVSNEKATADAAFNKGNHIVIYQSCDINALRDSNYLYDIGDIVTGKTITVKDGVSFTYDKAIVDRLSDSQKALLSKGTSSYVAVPHYETFGGLFYDVNLFDDCKWYFKDTTTNTFVTSLSEKSVGPDGKTGVIGGIDYSADDGLPATYTQFYALCDKIVEDGTKPMIFPGANKRYANFLPTQAYLCLAGKTASYHYDFANGKTNTINYVSSFSGNTPNVEEATIDSTTLYKMFQQVEKYQALQLMDNLFVSDGEFMKYFANSSCGNARNNTDAQKEFVMGTTMQGAENCAMIVEGSYWVNEAKTHIDYYNNKAGNTAKKYAYMPLPACVDSYDSNKAVNSCTLADQAECYMMIDKKSVGSDTLIANLAKDFIMFANTEENLQEFTTITGVTKALKYDMSSSNLSQLSSYTQNLWNAKLKAEANDLLLYFGSDNAIYSKAANTKYLSINNSQSRLFWYNGKTSELYYTFRETEDNWSAKQSFDGMKKDESSFN